MTVALEEVDDGEVWCRLAIRDRGAFEDQPPRRVVRVDELVDQARLPHAGLPHQRHHLAMTGPSPLQGLLQCRQLVLPPYEAGEPPCCAGLQTPSDRTGPDQLKDLHGLCEPLDGNRA